MNHSSVLSYKTHIRSLIALGFPIIIGQIGTIVQGLADTIMTGQYSSQALAAAGFVNNVMTLVLIFAMGYSYGLTPVVGAYHEKSTSISDSHCVAVFRQMQFWQQSSFC